jgi:hypothetical protein
MNMSSNMNMNVEGSAGPHMQMALPALPAGSYKLWLEFRGTGGRLFTAPFTLRVQ